MSLQFKKASTAKSYKITMKQRKLMLKMHKAITVKNHEKLKMLLSIVDCNVISNKYFGEKLLDLAINLRDHVSVHLLLDQGANKNYDKRQYACKTKKLVEAIYSGNYKLVKRLINRGVNLDIHYDYWHEISSKEDFSIYECLIKCKGQKIGDHELGQKLLLAACGLGSIDNVEYLLNQGVSIESTDYQNWTCIFYAAAYKNESIIRLLIDRGANLNQKDFKNRNLLHIAILENPDDFSVLKNHSLYVGSVSLKIIEMLIDKGVDINATDINGLTPINTAFSAKKINQKIITLLLGQRDIDLSKPDINGTTLLHRAINRISDYKESERLLRNPLDRYILFLSFLINPRPRPFNLLKHIIKTHKVDINARDVKGRTPLYFINSKSLHYLTMLLNFGADTEALHYLPEEVFKKTDFWKDLKYYQLKRKFAGLNEDQNIDNLFKRHGVLLCEKEFEKDVTMFSEQIEKMKKTILCNKLTYYDFLHAKKRTCIKVAKIPGIRETLIEYKHKFSEYARMLAKNYLSGARPFTSIESDAITFAENNLDIVFNNKLPNLVLYNIKKYLDIEDMVTLENMNQFKIVK